MRYSNYCLLFVFLLWVSACTTPKAISKNFVKSEGQEIKITKIIEGQGTIWGMDFYSDEHMVFTEREGKIKSLHIPTRTITEFRGGPNVYASGQGGLLDIQLHPQFNKNHWVYLCYSTRLPGGNTTQLARMKMKKFEFVKSEILFTAKPYYDTSHHFGCRISFDHEGHLFMGIGDRGQRDDAQDLSRHNGKIIRLKEDGSLPEDNPFIKIAGAQPEIWSYGHRNPQGLKYDVSTKILWEHEHGPRGGDEINIIKKSLNYGWPVITYGREYSGFKVGEGISKKEAMEQPIKYYVPSIAPSGLEIYSGKLMKAWKGDLFIGALALTHLNRVSPSKSSDKNEERLMGSYNERIRAIRESPSGKLYVSTDSGRIYELSL